MQEKKKISCPPEKKSKAKNTDDVWKVIISDKMQESKKNFCPPKTKEQSQKQRNNDDFRKVVISDKIQEKKNFCPSKKRAKPKTKITTNFETSLFMIEQRMRCAIYIPLMQ